jgi:mannose-1-phosphate guanylyltransferase
MILCAGLGTRLRPLTDERAKPIVPVGDRAALAHVLDRVRGAPRLVVNVHHRPDDVRAFARAHGLAVSEEVDLLGTAGGVAKARALLGSGDVLVWNGDILCDLDVAELVAAHAGGGAEATLVVRPREAGSGNVGLDEAGRVVRLRKETTAPGEVRGGEFLGVHVLGAALRRTLPDEGCLVGDVYLPAMRRGAVLRALCTGLAFWDVGTLASYLAANLGWLGARGSWRAPDAALSSGARLERSVVGAGARVEGEGAVERCVVWPGATARAPIADAIVTPAQVVRVTA